jgi:integrase
MAYGGLRPGEALALRTSSVRERTILVERAISFGKEKGTKTGGVRHPRALGALPREVADWRAKARLGPDDLLVSRDDGTPWREYDYRNWRRRVFKPAAEAADLGSVNPYSLRHSWASLLLRSPEFHADPARIARMAGHSLQTFFRYYAHEIEEFAGQPVLEPEAVIANARAEVSEQLRLL